MNSNEILAMRSSGKDNNFPFFSRLVEKMLTNGQVRTCHWMDGKSLFCDLFFNNTHIFSSGIVFKLRTNYPRNRT